MSKFSAKVFDHTPDLEYLNLSENFDKDTIAVSTSMPLTIKGKHVLTRPVADPAVLAATFQISTILFHVQQLHRQAHGPVH